MRHAAITSTRARAIPVVGGARESFPDAGMAPMLATLGSMPTDLDAYAYEVKWDGYRALAHTDGRSFRLCSRNGVDLTERFPEITAQGSRMKRPVLLDGELVAMDGHGHPSFSALQTRMPRGGGPQLGRKWNPARFTLTYMVFDILHLDGHSTRGLAYTKRRKLLEDLALPGTSWQVPCWYRDGPALLEVMRRTAQEGIIAKRLTSTYQVGKRSRDWLKVKLNQSDEFVIAGYWSSGKHGLSSLLLGCYPTAKDALVGRNLRFCGKVGTGFSEADRIRLQRMLTRIASPTPVVTGALPKGLGVSWCKPLLVAQIHYAEWTYDGALRHPVFEGLRSDKQPADVVVHPR